MGQCEKTIELGTSIPRSAHAVIHELPDHLVVATRGEVPKLVDLHPWILVGGRDAGIQRGPEFLGAHDQLYDRDAPKMNHPTMRRLLRSW
ncbi:MAG: hypothetical protein IPG04_16735 [Polyangiaceae bacterium]|nr:hypothetical protein [Polyangiaceae bacterium]